MNQDLIAGAVALAFTLLVVVTVAIMTIKSLIVIVPPNMAAVLTGRNRKLPSGDTVGLSSRPSSIHPWRPSPSRSR
jgi:hypothetical protein